MGYIARPCIRTETKIAIAKQKQTKHLFIVLIVAMAAYKTSANCTI